MAFSPRPVQHRQIPCYRLSVPWGALHETEIDALIRKGLLKPDTRNDPSAVSDALYAFLDGTIGVTP
jgi:hypothetical protein